MMGDSLPPQAVQYLVEHSPGLWTEASSHPAQTHLKLWIPEGMNASKPLINQPQSPDHILLSSTRVKQKSTDLEPCCCDGAQHRVAGWLCTMHSNRLSTHTGTHGHPHLAASVCVAWAPTFWHEPCDTCWHFPQNTPLLYVPWAHFWRRKFNSTIIRKWWPEEVPWHGFSAVTWKVPRLCCEL